MKMSDMQTASLFALLVLFGGAEATAQNGMNKGSTSVGQTINGGIPDAPIGHRQPRAGEIPDEKNLANRSLSVCRHSVCARQQATKRLYV